MMPQQLTLQQPSFPPSASVSKPPPAQPLSFSKPPDNVASSTHYKHLQSIKSGKVVKQRKPYCCSKCGNETKDGNHPQVRGKTYCKNDPTAVPFETFKADVEKAYQEKKTKKQKNKEAEK